MNTPGVKIPAAFCCLCASLFLGLMLVSCEGTDHDKKTGLTVSNSVNYHPANEVYITQQQLVFSAVTLGHAQYQKTDRLASQVFLPKEAIINFGKHHFILLKKQTTKVGYIFERREVFIGARAGNLVDIMASDLKASDEVITKGGLYLML